jgi:hypothetical protein
MTEQRRNIATSSRAAAETAIKIAKAHRDLTWHESLARSDCRIALWYQEVIPYVE